MSEAEDLVKVAQAAREAAAELAPLPRAPKDAALRRIADALVAATDEIIEANAEDVARAEESGTSAAMIDRLRLDAGRIEAIAAAVRQIADLPDPVGEAVRGTTLPNGLELRQVRVPLGVIGIIYEVWRTVAVYEAARGHKSGNVGLLCAWSDAHAANPALVRVMQRALAVSEVPGRDVQRAPGQPRESARWLIRAREYVDVRISRGGA